MTFNTFCELVHSKGFTTVRVLNFGCGECLLWFFKCRKRQSPVQHAGGHDVAKQSSFASTGRSVNGERSFLTGKL